MASGSQHHYLTAETTDSQNDMLLYHDLNYAIVIGPTLRDVQK